MSTDYVPITAIRLGRTLEPAPGELCVGLLRATDLVTLDLYATGLTLVRGRSPYLVADAGAGTLRVSFPAQHFAEQAWPKDDDPGDALAQLLGAGRTQLVYTVPEGTRIAFDVGGVLAALNRLAQVEGDGGTEIGAPCGLALRPEPRTVFTHRTAPSPAPRAPGHVELWHTRLGAPDSAPPAVRAVRADSVNISTSLSDRDRTDIVEQSTRKSPITALRLDLSGLGAWLDLHGHWPGLGRWGPWRGSNLAAWDHVAPMGRDQFVQVVRVGRLAPFGHTASLVKQTERLIEQPAGRPPVARLRTRHYLLVTEPVRTYTARDLPFRSVRVAPPRTPDLHGVPDDLSPTTRLVPALPPPAGSTTPTPFGFLLEAIDHDGRAIHLTTPLEWLGTALYAGGVAELAPEVVVGGAGQAVAFAPSRTAGDTSAHVHDLRFGARAGGGDIQPHLITATVTPPAAAQLPAKPLRFAIRYPERYLREGFATTPAGRDPDTFAEVVGADRVPIAPGDRPKLEFGSTEQCGGFVNPSQPIAELCRATGVRGVPAGAGDRIDPKTLLDGFGLPKLFGLIPLAEVLLPLVGDALPTVVTETLNAATGLIADCTTVADELIHLTRLARDAVADAQASKRTPAAWATTLLRTDLPGLARGLRQQAAAVRELAGTASADRAAVASAVEAIRRSVGTARSAVAAASPPPVPAGRLARLVEELHRRTADATRVDETVGQVLGVLRDTGADLARREVRTRLRWNPPLKPWPNPTNPVFVVAEDNPLSITVESRVSLGGAPQVDAQAVLNRFELRLFGENPLLAIRFERLAFRGGSARKPEIDLVFDRIEFLGPLSFIETLRHLIPLDGFSDPPAVDVTPERLRASFSVSIPSVAVGVFALQNLALSADCVVPFVSEKERLSVGFAISRRERPFSVAVAFLGGGGFFGIRLSPSGLDLLEFSLEFGARLAVDFGVASGSVEVMAGVYMRLEGTGGSLTGYFRMRGQVDVLGLISASVELTMELVYEFATGKLVGRASLVVSVQVFMFSVSVTLSVERRFAGSNGDPTFAQLLDAGPDGSSSRWSEYCAAFAGE